VFDVQLNWQASCRGKNSRIKRSQKKHQCVSRMQKLICISRAIQKSTQFQAVEEKCQPSNIKLFAQTLLALPTLLAGLGMPASCWGMSGAQGQGGQDEASLLGFDIRVGGAGQSGARPSGTAKWHGQVYGQVARPGVRSGGTARCTVMCISQGWICHGSLQETLIPIPKNSSAPGDSRAGTSSGCVPA